MALSFGCSHYKRKCKFVSPCCRKIYPCRLCHDAEESHSLNRKNVNQIQCSVCSTRQLPRSNCCECEVRFGKYYCLECNLFDDEDKGQYHCDGCGICRVGGAANFYHCDTCNMCLSLGMLGNHKCIENRAHTDCPVCMEDMHSSTRQLEIPSCGHLLHKDCVDDLKKAGYTTCPTCKASLGQ